MRKLIISLAAAGLALPVALPAPAMARHHYHHQRYSQNSYYQGRTWRDNQGRMRCKRSNGTTGLIIGAAGGALAGRAIDTHGERATGTVLGGVAGALLGRSIDRGSKVHCR
jgi:outer membrane lipoprotein SlyB